MTSRYGRQLAGAGFALLAALAMTTAIGTQALAGSDSHAAAKDAKHASAKSMDQVALNARDLLPQEQSYYRYMGSLTTQPCTEGVYWYVMTQPVSVSADQVELLAKAVGHNNRPVQDVNHRLVLAPNGNSHSSH